MNEILDEENVTGETKGSGFNWTTSDTLQL